ncbi:MAG: sugar-binding protein [Monoglobaceae bacterium]
MKKRICIISLAAALVLILMPQLISAEEDGVKTITVMPYERQEIKGWGFFADTNYGGVLDQGKTSNHTPGNVIDKAVMSKMINDFGITMFRQDLMVQCGNTDGSLNLDWMDKLAEAIKVMVDGGIVEYEITAWGVPLGMVEKDTSGSNALRVDCEENYCKFVVNAFKYITDQGLPAPVGFSIQNEPQDGRHWVRMYADQYARLTKKMRKALDENGFEDIMLLGPENAGYFQYFTQMEKDYAKLYNDPEFARALGALTTHAYYFITSGNSQPEDAYRFDMTASNFPHMERWETEYSGGLAGGEGIISQEMRAAIQTAQILVGDVAWSGMNRWFYWNGFDWRQYIYPNGNIKFMDSGQLGTHQSLNYGDGIRWARKNVIGTTLSTIWKNVPVGSIVHRVWTDDETVRNKYDLKGDMVAFERPDGNNVIIVINESSDTKTYNINSVAGKSAKVHTITQDTDQMGKVTFRNIVNGKIKEFVAEPWSVNIIVTDKEDVSAPKISLDADNSIYYENGVYSVVNNDVTIKGTVDEELESFKINGEDIKVAGDRFEYSFDASKAGVLNILLKDKNENITTEKLVFEYVPSLLKLDLENVVESTNDKNYVIKGHTNREAAIESGGKEVKTDSNNQFEIGLNLSEGSNTVTVTAKIGGGSVSESFNIFCDSIKPEITIKDFPKEINDYEYLFKGSVNEDISQLTINDKKVLIHPDKTFEAKAVLLEGNNEVVFTAVDKYGNTSTKTENITYVRTEDSPHFVDGVAYARKITAPIKIDGKLDEPCWKMDLKIARQVIGAYAANNIVNFGVMWDENNFYIGAEVEDAKLYWDNKYPYLNDSIEFLLNPSNQKAGSFVPEDRQVFTGPINGDLESVYENAKIKIEQAYNIENGRFTVEIAVPWTEMGKTAKEGEKIGFEIVNNDDDLGGSNRDSIQTWTSTTENYYSLTTTFGTVELVGEDVFKYDDISYINKEEVLIGAPTITVDGITLYELNSVLEKYGAVYYDNPNTGLVNVFTSMTRRVDIKENAKNIFVDGNMVTLDVPIAKQNGFYYVDPSFEKYVFANIPAFEKYPE